MAKPADNPLADWARANPREAIAAARRARAARVVKARSDVNAFVEYVIRNEQNNEPVVQGTIHEEWQALLDRNDQILIWAPPEHGKALAIDTPIPTPDGFVYMGEVQVGDLVYGRDGRVCTVTAATKVMHDRRVYRVSFDDNSWLVADGDHRWLAALKQDFAIYDAPSVAHAGDGPLCACGCGLRAATGKRYVHNHHGRKQRGWRVVTTAEMIESAARWRIPRCEPVDYPRRDLPVHPYVLGAWLGDGDSTSPRLTFHERDRFIYDTCVALEGGDTAPTRDKRRPLVMTGSIGAYRDRRGPRGTRRLRTRLAALGVLGNKHVPNAYLLGSIEQRRELLAGLIDTDGSVDPKGRVEFSNTNRRLAVDALELVRSLGFKATMISRAAKLRGRVVGVSYAVCFTAREPVFRLPRKLAGQRLGVYHGRTRYRTVVAIDPVGTVPVKCIAVDSPDNTYLAGRSYTVTHNTNQISIARPLFELGKNANLRIAIISNVAGPATKIVNSIKRYIEQSAELRQVFPRLVRSPRLSDPWTQNAITVQRESSSKDPSLQAVGLHGAIIGSRIDVLVLDDILDPENTRTPYLRDDTWNWIKWLFGRLSAEAKVWVMGNAFHPDDALHRLQKEWGPEKWRRTPALNAQGLPRWPEGGWTTERIEKTRIRLGPLEFARQMLCMARSDEQARFDSKWIAKCEALGKNARLLANLREAPIGCMISIGVDLAVQQHDAADETSIFTLLVHPDQTRQVISIETGRWTGPVIIDRIYGAYSRFGAHVVVVENNAAQDFIIQFAQDRYAIPIRPFTTGRNKAHPEFGVESIAAEMAAGKWIIPSAPDQDLREVDAWKQDMLYYDPKGHTGDRLMASWFAREGARGGVPPTVETGRVDLMRR